MHKQSLNLSLLPIICCAAWKSREHMAMRLTEPEAHAAQDAVKTKRGGGKKTTNRDSWDSGVFVVRLAGIRTYDHGVKSHWVGTDGLY